MFVQNMLSNTVRFGLRSCRLIYYNLLIIMSSQYSTKKTFWCNSRFSFQSVRSGWCWTSRWCCDCKEVIISNVIRLFTICRFAAEGYHVAMVARTEEQLRQTHSEITDAGHSCIYLAADIGNPEECQKVFGNLFIPSVSIDTIQKE